MISSPSFAVMLNAQARRVTDRVLSCLTEIVPPEDIFLSRSEREGEEIAREILHRHYPTVFTGGGDGTVVHFINRMIDHSTALGTDMPDIGILRLGTGNALAQMVSSGSYLCDLKSYVLNSHRDHHVLPLVESEGRRFPFAGLGWDAELLNDYCAVKHSLGSTVLKPLVQNVGGYFTALFSRTIPRRAMSLAMRRRSRARVVNAGGTAYKLSWDGRRIRAFAPGETIYEGTANCVLAGTCPYYGYGMKVLPHANQSPDTMQVRVVRAGIPHVLLRLRSIWRGVYRGQGFADFHAERVRIEYEEPTPYQESGDAMGFRQNVELGVSSARVNLVRFI